MKKYRNFSIEYFKSILLLLTLFCHSIFFPSLPFYTLSVSSYLVLFFSSLFFLFFPEKGVFIPDLFFGSPRLDRRKEVTTTQLTLTDYKKSDRTSGISNIGNKKGLMSNVSEDTSEKGSPDVTASKESQFRRFERFTL